MKKCSRKYEAIVKRLRDTFFLVAMCYTLFCCEMEIVCGRCVHDELEPIRRVSPQNYLYSIDENDWNNFSMYSTVPHSTPSMHTRYSRVGYYYRYRKIRYKTTPVSNRPKRYVENESRTADLNDTYAENDNQTSTKPSSQPLDDTTAVKEVTDLPNGKTYEIYKTKYTNDTGSDSTVQDTTNDTIDYSVLFRPIRIALYYDDEHIEYSNTSVEYKRLTDALERAVEKIEKILSVIPVEGPLLFQRSMQDICYRFWHNPAGGLGRCGIANPSYNGERCLDGFKIPDDHLQGYAIYEDSNSEEPTHMLYENGTGLPDTDTVIYIRARKTGRCANQGTRAYASYCELDQYNRPIAGFANFCPGHLENTLYDSDKLYLTALHEFFHALGFSKRLFDKFQECFARKVDTEDNENKDDPKMDWVCEKRAKADRFIDNQIHLVTPAVKREIRKHLDCETKPGCPLENSEDLPLASSSHWDGRFMQGSLMSPTIGMPHLTFIDPMTLAAFEDMGWYKVDYSQSELFYWGKGAGCSFGSFRNCHAESPYFCNQRNVRSGCHYLHLDKGTCETDPFLDGCRIYKAYSGMECWKPYNRPENTNYKGEVYSMTSRCFLSNLVSNNAEHSRFLITRNHLEGRCYQHRCNDSNTLEVRVEGSEWQECSKGDLVEFEGYNGVLSCPPASLLCAHDLSDTMARSKTTNTTGATHKSDPLCATIRITFPKLAQLRALIKNQEKKPQVAEEARLKLNMFLVKFTNQIIHVTEIDETRIVDIKYVGEFTIQFVVMKNVDWTTLVPKDPGTSISPDNYDDTGVPNLAGGQLSHYNYIEISCEEAVRRLLVSVKGGNLKVNMNGQIYKADSINFTSPDKDVMVLGIDEQDEEKPSNIENTAAAAVGAVCGTMLLTVGALLYWKSHVTTAVSPSPPSPTSTDVRYHPNGSTAAPSEVGSMGQLTFMA